jgi:eukaryotic-like serine/threonine-protein kinase
MGWEAGTQVGSYEILGPLGYGGMGEVYKVKHQISHRVEAMKVLLPNTSQKADLIDRFLREIRVLANLSHPHIAALHTAFHDRDQLVMVMEFVEGQNLSEKLYSGITIRKSIAYITQVLSALEYAHSRCVIHRDIKPSNVMITSEDQVKLLDFGLALSTPDARLTSVGAILGSVYYMSPEQIQGETLDARSDLYSVGITLYELLTGHLPITGKSPAEIIAAHLQTTPPEPNAVNPAISQSLSTVVMRAIAKNRGERFQSSSEFLSALVAAELRQTSDVPVAAVTMVGDRILPTIPTPRPETPLPGMERRDSPTPRSKRYEPAVLEDISKQLANYVGPIAAVLVKRASSNSMNLSELCDQVASEIDSPDCRQKFLLAVRKHYLSSGGAA